MKKTLLFLLFLIPVVAVNAQQQPAQKSKDLNADVSIDMPMDTSKTVSYDPSRIFTSVEQIPTFPGGFDAFYKYLAQNIHYPAGAAKDHIQGKVFVIFVVEKDGSLTDMKIIRGVSPDIDAEAIRVLKSSPKWKPGIQNGRPVRVQFSVPISFSLQAK
jgi:periplasmic protein TonB